MREKGRIFLPGVYGGERLEKTVDFKMILAFVINPKKGESSALSPEKYLI